MDNGFDLKHIMKNPCIIIWMKLNMKLIYCSMKVRFLVENRTIQYNIKLINRFFNLDKWKYNFPCTLIVVDINKTLARYVYVKCVTLTELLYKKFVKYLSLVCIIKTQNGKILLRNHLLFCEFLFLYNIK